MQITRRNMLKILLNVGKKIKNVMINKAKNIVTKNVLTLKKMTYVLYEHYKKEKERMLKNTKI